MSQEIGVAETLAKFKTWTVELYHTGHVEITQDGVTITGDTDINGNLDLTGSASTRR